jgi:hypothetical protein
MGPAQKKQISPHGAIVFLVSLAISCLKPLQRAIPCTDFALIISIGLIRCHPSLPSIIAKRQIHDYLCRPRYAFMMTGLDTVIFSLLSTPSP